MKPNSVEETRIYRIYMDFIIYLEMITEKYPSRTKLELVSTIKNTGYNGMHNILLAYKSFDKAQKLKYLNELDINLKMQRVYARISYKRKYINIRNYEAWSRKINLISMSLGGWINSCLKQ